MDSAHRLENGPAASLSVRRLLYLGDGLLFGVLLYVGAYVAVTVTPASLLHPIYILLVIYVALNLAPLYLVPLLVRPEERRNSIPLEEWYEIRRWRWIALMGSLVAGLLTVSSALVWGWNWPVRIAVPVMMGGALLGVLLRVAGIYLIEQHNPELEQAS